VTVLAVVRPDAWNLPLLLHVLGAMVLVGAITLGVLSLATAWRSGSAATLRLGVRALLWAGLPAWVVMYAGALWTASKEGYEQSGAPSPSWIGIGHITAEGGLLLLLVATLLAHLAVRRAARGTGRGSLDRVAGVLVAIVLIGYLVAIWAMTTKPT
jgi:hypothetical protein